MTFGMIIFLEVPETVHERSVLRQRGEAIDVHAER